MKQTLGKRIVTNRKRLSLTQDQLAEKLGVTAQAVSKWENEQSCPDISILPQLAKIFGISTDELLGYDHENTVHEAEIVDDNAHNNGIHVQKGNWEFQWENSKKGGLGLAALVLLAGGLYLLSILFVWDLTFWDILWPSTLFVFGLYGIITKFSFFSLGCTVFGGYFLLNKLVPLKYTLDSKIIWAILLLLVGISLLADALRKSKKPKFSMNYAKKGGMAHCKRTKNDYSVSENSFAYTASFGEDHQLIKLPCLENGEVSVSFGEYTVDLSGIANIASGCMLDINCSFGELTLLVPTKYAIRPDSSTAFAEFCIDGQPDSSPTGQIQVDASVSFGQIRIRYI